MTNFLIGRAYRDYLSAMGFCVEQVLKKGRAAGGSVRAAGAVPGRGGILPLPAGHRGALPDKDAPVRLAFSALTGASVSKSRQPGV